VREYEPRIALVAGPEGHELVARLVPQAAARLLAGGSFVTEISPALERRIYRIVEEDGRFAAPRTLKDLAGLPRVIVAQRQ
jgi:release factor glutamine methyltransferase